LKRTFKSPLHLGDARHRAWLHLQPDAPARRRQSGGFALPMQRGRKMPEGGQQLAGLHICTVEQALQFQGVQVSHVLVALQFEVPLQPCVHRLGGLHLQREGRSSGCVTFCLVLLALRLRRGLQPGAQHQGTDPVPELCAGEGE